MFHESSFIVIGTVGDLQFIMYQNSSHKNIEQLSFVSFAKDKFLSQSDEAELSKHAIKTVVQYYPTIKKFYANTMFLNHSLDGNRIKVIIKQRKRKINVEEMCDKLEKEFSEVTSESKDGFLYMTEMDVMRKLIISKENLKKVIDHGVEQKVFKRSEEEGETIICYIKSSHLEKKEQELDEVFQKLKKILENAETENEEGFRFLPEEACLEVLEIDQATFNKVIEPKLEEGVIEVGMDRGKQIIIYAVERRLKKEFLL